MRAFGRHDGSLERMAFVSQNASRSFNFSSRFDGGTARSRRRCEFFQLAFNEQRSGTAYLRNNKPAGMKVRFQAVAVRGTRSAMS
jgi:hypothetical protein